MIVPIDLGLSLLESVQDVRVRSGCHHPPCHREHDRTNTIELRHDPFCSKESTCPMETFATGGEDEFRVVNIH